MPDEIVESVEVISSEESPSEVIETTETQAEETPAEKVETVEPELYDLPDGRKVDSATLAREFKENFLPEFTRKSQELAALKKDKPETEEVNPYKDPNYIPENYQEIIEVAKAKALQEIDARSKLEAEKRQALETEVGNQLAEVKKTDPTVDESLLFLHANKYGFRDLRTAYQNMKDMNALVKNVQKTTEKNIQRRANEQISTTPGKAGATIPNPSNFANAVDYLRSLQ
jgi:hypothetical protein